MGSNLFGRQYLTASLLFLALLTSQFYIFSSGLLQPGHGFFILIFISFFLNLKSFKRGDRDIVKYLFFFVTYAVFVNFSWSVLEQDAEFLKSLLFWFFGALLLMSCCVFFIYTQISLYVRVSILISIFILIFMWLLGLGRFNFFPRYNAYFNDPNQMAFWVLCATSVYFFLTSKNNKFIMSALLLISGFLIFLTISRSALLGFSFLAFGVLLRLQRFDLKVSLSRRIVYVLSGSIIAIGFLFYLGSNESFSNILDRFLTTDFRDQAEIRGYTRFFLYPEYLFFGAGQGLDTRFGTHHEIHSSWAALFFYYGVVGLFLFLVFLYKIFIKLDLSERIVFLGPLVYGFSTYGLRSPIFWVFLGAAMYAAKKVNNSKPINSGV